MRIKTDTAIGAAYWASALINGDYTGLTDAEEKLCNQWLARLPAGAEVIDCGEPYFTWSYGLHTGADCKGGDVCEYTLILRHIKKPTMREALEQIRDYPANGNSEPDAMADAIDTMQNLARLALDKGNRT